MAFKLKCPSCGHSQRVSEEVFGKKISCPSCSSTFRVPVPKPAASAAAAPAATETPPEDSGYGLVPDPVPAAVKKAPAPKLELIFDDPDLTESKPRGGLPIWALAAAGGAGFLVLVLIAGVVLIRFLVSAGSSRVPDPAADVALGVASPSGSQAAPAGRTQTAAPSLVSQSLVSSTALARDIPPAAPPAASPARGAPLTTAELVKRCESSVALVKGNASSGTGFLVRPGVVATNSHVIDDEFISGLEIRFPSAAEGKQGPFPAELLYEDPKRDLAFLSVATDLPAMEIAPILLIREG